MCQHRFGIRDESSRYRGFVSDSPEDAIISSIDEKPSMQVLSRTVGYVKTQDGATMWAYKSTYRHNGTLNLFGALEIATRQIHEKCTKYKKRSDLLQFMDELLKELPSNDEGSTTYHVILDNYCIHNRYDECVENASEREVSLQAYFCKLAEHG